MEQDKYKMEPTMSNHYWLLKHSKYESKVATCFASSILFLLDCLTSSYYAIHTFSNYRIIHIIMFHLIRLYNIKWHELQCQQLLIRIFWIYFWLFGNDKLLFQFIMKVNLHLNFLFPRFKEHLTCKTIQED